MNRQPLEIEVRSKLGFEATVAALVEAVPQHKMTVLAVHPLSQTLASKGFPREPISVIEVCNARMASQALEDDVRVALMMPCPVAVFERAGEVHVSTMDTRLLSQMYEGERMPTLGQEMFAELSALLQIVADR